MAGICYFHERDVIYHASGEDESCLLFRFKRAEYQHTVLLKLKGEKLHQGFYTELAEHSHGVGTLDVAEGGAHVHGVGTLAVEDSESHTHGVGTYAVGSESNHTHGYGTIAVVAAAAHSHTKGTLAVGDAGAHSHGYGTIAVVAAGDHGHAIGTLAVSVGGSHGHAIGTLAVVDGGAHGHADTFDIDSVGNHNHGAGSLAGSQPNHAHTVSGNTANANLAHTHSSGGYGTDEKPSHEHGGVSTGSGFTGLAGVHSHDVNGDSGPWSIANLHNHSISFNTGNAGDDDVSISGYVADGGGHDHGLSGSVTAASDHGHSLSGVVADAANHGHNLTGTVADGGGHGHALSGSTAQEADHDHILTGSVADGGGHAHTLTGSTAADGGHDHSLSGASASGGVHSHSLSGSTVSAGNHDHSIAGDTADYGTTPKTYSDQLKIYINGVDKTTEVLALTDLTEFGDGTAGHDFVTVGSGEMNISLLVADAQTHEIKVTEPTNGKGGRVLCHIECLFEMGEQGPQGSGGEQGPQGPQGYLGVQGPGGVIGTQGPQGSIGHQGNQGYQGFVGVQGPVGGAQGYQGTQGEQGAQGDIGSQGAAGDQGAVGPQGDQGEIGAQGPQGDQGDEGAQGAQGYQGEQGAQGEAADHNALTGLQGGQADQYYHLTAAEHGYISGVNAQSLLKTASPSFVNITAWGDLSILREAASTSCTVKVWSSGAGWHAPTFRFFRGRGTEAVPVAILNNDSMCVMPVVGQYDGANTYEGGKILWQAAENWDNLNRGITYRIQGTNLGAVALSDWLVIEDGDSVFAGDITMGQFLQLTHASAVVIRPSVDTGQMTIYGSNTQNEGAKIEFFGGDHAGTPGNIYLDYGDFTKVAPAGATLNIRAMNNTAIITALRCDITGHLDIWDWDDSVLREVDFGVDDSGGTGFKVLRVPN